MSWLTIASCLILAASSEDAAVYRYRDPSGVDHYVNHLELVPEGIKAKRVTLSGDLNPELARDLTESAERAAREAKAQAARELQMRAEEQAAKGIPSLGPAPAAPAPPEARLLLIWAISFSVVFFVLWAFRGVLLHKSPPLAVAFQPVRWGTGIAAALSWIVLVVLARGWIADRFPPLQSIAHAKASVDQINRQQQQSERELEKALNGGREAPVKSQ